MKCPECRSDMDYEDFVHRWNERTWFCECGYEETEDITGDLIDYAKDEYQDREINAIKQEGV